MRRLGSLWLYQQAYRSLDEELDKINSVTMDDLERVAATYPISPSVIGRLRPAS